MTKKILVTFGTRPEAIKMAPVIEALKVHPSLEVKVCVTAQHRQMLDQVLQLFGIEPDYDLNLMKPGQDLTDITANVLLGMRSVLSQWRPDWVLVHGDTTTAFTASVAAFYEKVPVGHVEAGLRTGNIYSPWPEEMNRRLVGAIAALHLAPTELAKHNLIREGIPIERIHVTGNTVIDALLKIVERLRKGTVGEGIYASLVEKFPTLRPLFTYRDHRLILVTGHRRENFGEGFQRICRALAVLADREDVQIVYPVHLNPNVQEPVWRILGDHPRIHLIEPLDYLPFVALMDRAYLIITDSGGVQEEAPSLGKPVLVLRHTTERPEAIEAGTVKLVGTDEEMIIAEAGRLLDNFSEYNRMALAHNPYGDGLAALRIAQLLESSDEGRNTGLH